MLLRSVHDWLGGWTRYGQRGAPQCGKCCTPRLLSAVVDAARRPTRSRLNSHTNAPLLLRRPRPSRRSALVKYQGGGDEGTRRVQAAACGSTRQLLLLLEETHGVVVCFFGGHPATACGGRNAQGHRAVSVCAVRGVVHVMGDPYCRTGPFVELRVAPRLGRPATDPDPPPRRCSKTWHVSLQQTLRWAIRTSAESRKGRRPATGPDFRRNDRSPGTSAEAQDGGDPQPVRTIGDLAPLASAHRVARAGAIVSPADRLRQT
jgi:hypothetical protein